MFSIVESNNYVFEDDNPADSPGEGLQVVNFAHYLHIVLVIGKQTGVFRGIFLVGGQGKKVTWKDLSMEEFFMGEGNYP